MLIGAAGRPARDRDRPFAFCARDRAARWLEGDGAAAAVRPWAIVSLDREQRWAEDPSTDSWLVLSGRLLTEEPAGSNAPDAAELLLERLTEKGADALAAVDGSFAIAWYDGRRRRLQLIRDRFGAEPLFYAEVAGGVIFGSRIRDLRQTGLLDGALCPQGLVEFLTYFYVPGDATLDRGVRKVPPGSWIAIDTDGRIVERERWYTLSFAGAPERDEAAIAARFRDLLESAVVRRLGEGRLGALLSGGMDSSSVVTFARRHRAESIQTFGFRCGGASFDESVYARGLAEAMDAEHTEVEFGEPQALEIEDFVGEMDVPFCDCGINVGTWILGGAAAGRVEFLLTGDGGDELWASHPVYAAERLVHRYEQLPVPRALHRALLWGASRLRDSDQKRDLRVKLKRILPAEGLPRELGPFRWRAYANPDEIERQLTSDMAVVARGVDPFRCVIDAYIGYDGPDDGVSPHLYNDYTTASSFYFNRLGLLRGLGLETRSPFYDRALVEYGARIPVGRKLEGLEGTKRLFRAAMEGVLPDVINHRKDKLGHSVPLKLWLRESGDLGARVAEVLSPESIGARGLFRPGHVARLLEEHRERRHNHAHRIWGLYVLELWLRAREGRAAERRAA